MGVFKYENQAKAGHPMPDGLTMAEQCCYQAISDLTSRFRFGGISGEDAAKEKRIIESEFLNLSAKEKYISHCVMLWADVETASMEFAKNPTIENAYKMHEAIYGCVLKKREAVGE